ncbi:MAG: sigma 54-interacting transcriptional regulator [Candidatus Wallbacteria bacterium]
MKNIYLTWLDNYDLEQFSKGPDNFGPLTAFLNSKEAVPINEIHILFNKKTKNIDHVNNFLKYIRHQYSGKKIINLYEFDLIDKDFVKIFSAATEVIKQIEKDSAGQKLNWHFQIGAGTAQMCAIWLVLAKSKYPAILIMTSFDKTIGKFKNKIHNPDINIDSDTFDYLSKLKQAGNFKEWANIPEYNLIIHKNIEMRKIINDVYLIAKYDVPVLILGETGTGKELFAKAIHKSSMRKGKPLLTLNCAAIHENTANATLFGWSKGAWTGSNGEGKGLFLEANGGTLFLDEIGDLSLETQTKLLRAIQEGEVQRVGDGKILKTDVRIISATNKDLRKLIIDGKFREDLFYRINVGTLKIPPLRERGTDASHISKHFIDNINNNNKKIFGEYIAKKLSKSALDFIDKYNWPGNIRELYNTIQRVCIWNSGETINDEDIKKLIAGSDTPPENKQTELTANNSINLEELTNEFRKKYILKALELTNRSITGAARLLGYKNYQTFSNEMKKLKIK